jgi:hypothetical protein
MNREHKEYSLKKLSVNILNSVSVFVCNTWGKTSKFIQDSQFLVGIPTRATGIQYWIASYLTTERSVEQLLIMCCAKITIVSLNVLSVFECSNFGDLGINVWNDELI